MSRIVRLILSTSRVGALTCFLVLSCAQHSHAGFMFTSGGQPPDRCGFQIRWDWDKTNASTPPDFANPRQFGFVPNWNGQVQSAGGPELSDTNRPWTITATVNHANPPPCHDTEGGAGPHAISVSIPSVTRSGRYRAVKQFDHLNTPHWDVLSLEADITTAGKASEVTLGARHGGALAATWSFSTRVDGTLSVFATFPDGALPLLIDQHVQDWRKPFAQRLLNQPLPKGATDWEYDFFPDVLVASDDPPPGSHMHLAFLGEVNDLPGKLELAPVFELFLEQGHIEAPLFHSSEQELFIFVDLNRWLLEPVSLNDFDTLPIINGFNDLLPGYFFSNSPISIVGNQVIGQSGFTGNATFVAIADGEVIPLPSTLALLLVGAVAMCFSRSLRCRAILLARPAQ